MSSHIKPWRETAEAATITASWDAIRLADAEIAELRAALAASPTEEQLHLMGQAAFDAGKAYGEFGAAPLPQQAAGDERIAQRLDDWNAFKAWAEQHLGQGYSLETEEGTYVDKVTRWAFNGFKAGRRFQQAIQSDKPTAAQIIEGQYATATLETGKFYWVWIALDPDTNTEWENEPMPARFAGYTSEGKETWNFLDPEPDEWPSRLTYHIAAAPSPDGSRWFGPCETIVEPYVMPTLNQDWDEASPMEGKHEQEEFESWAKEYGADIRSNKSITRSDVYEDPETDNLWTGWKTRAQQAASNEQDAKRYRWIRDLKCNSFSIGRDESHACNYVTAKNWIETECPEDFVDIDPIELQAMKDTNTIWEAQIYLHTPIGFNLYLGATLDSIIDSAMMDQKESLE